MAINGAALLGGQLWVTEGPLSVFVKPNLCVCVQGMTEAEEDKLLALKDFMLKSNKAKANMGEQAHLGEAAQTGVIDLATLGITGRQVDLVKPKPEAEDKRGAEFRYVCSSDDRICLGQRSNLLSVLDLELNCF